MLRALFAGPDYCWNPRALEQGQLWHSRWGIQWPSLQEVSVNVLLRKVALLPFVAAEIMRKLVHVPRTGGMHGFLGLASLHSDKTAIATIFAALGLSTAPGTCSDQLYKQYEKESAAINRLECNPSSYVAVAFDNFGLDKPGGHVETVTRILQVPAPHAQCIR
jgi:hypothetical protein